MMMDKKLLEILVCPECKGPLTLVKVESGEELICKSDRLAFQINDGVPVMLSEQARVLNDDEVID